jgi:hypothetical protein
MSGTYELESTRGGNPRSAADTATRSLPPGQRDRAYQDLLARLDPPRFLAIDRTGQTITIASSRGPRVSFEADGLSRREHGAANRQTTTRANLVGDQLVVTTNGGGRGSDFSLTFESLDRGASLRVTRRLDDDDLPRPVTFESFYRRSDAAPRWDVYVSPEIVPYDGRRDYRSSPDAAIVPDGTRLVATLDGPLNMRTQRNGEPFSMTVRQPAEFQGARITGIMSRVNASRQTNSGQDLQIEFQTIQLRNRSSDFAAYLNTIRLQDGTFLRVTPDGVRDDHNQINAAQGGAIGATLGAVIGVIAGGGKGAAVGAIVGGVGGVILSQGHEHLDLPPGSEVTLTVVARGRRP